MNYLSPLAAAALIGWCAYRAWALLALDTITLKVRQRIFTEARQDRRVYKWLKLFWKCPWCAGFWINVVIVVLTARWANGGLPVPLLVLGAASAVTAQLGIRDERGFESDEALGYAPMADDEDSS